MGRPVKAFIFDLDGVIVDTARYHFSSWKAFAANHGFDIPDALNEKLKGVSRMEALEIVLEYAPDALRTDGDRQALAAEKNALYHRLLENLSEKDILPGVRRFLDEARALGMHLAIGSGSKNAGTIIDHLGIRALFDVVCDGNDISRSKPDPEVFVLACRQLGVAPEEAVVFEDAAAGIEAAIHAGTIPFGIGDPIQLHRAARVAPGFENLRAAEVMHSPEQSKIM